MNEPTIHTCHDKCKRPMCVMRRERDEARAQLAAERLQIKALNDRLDNALSDLKQADADSIRALGERNAAREQLAAERALADRLAGYLVDCLQSQEDIGHVMQALAAWNEARTPTEKKSDFS